MGHAHQSGWTQRPPLPAQARATIDVRKRERPRRTLERACPEAIHAGGAQADGLWRSAFPQAPLYGLSQYVALTMKTLSGLSPINPRASGPIEKAPTPLTPEEPSNHIDRFCCQTKNSVEPGRHSQRSTALPRSERTSKFGSPSEKFAAGPESSGSTV